LAKPFSHFMTYIITALTAGIGGWKDCGVPKRKDVVVKEGKEFNGFSLLLCMNSAGESAKVKSVH
jgi:hypothetical protein